MVLPPDEADAICSVFRSLHAPAERETMADNVVLDAHQLLRGWQRSPGIHEDVRLLKLFAPCRGLQVFGLLVVGWCVKMLSTSSDENGTPHSFRLAWRRLAPFRARLTEPHCMSV